MTRVYDDSSTQYSSGAVAYNDGGGAPLVSAWRSAELYGAGGSQSVAFDPLGTRVIIGGDNNGPKVSLDGGATWASAFASLPDGQIAANLQTVSVAWSLDPANPNRVWMGCLGGFFVSNDVGFTWQNISSFPGNFTQNGPTDAHPRVVGQCIVDAGDGNVYMVDNPGRVYRYVGFTSTGFGGSSSWTRIASLGETGTGIAVDPTDSRILFVTTREGGLYQIENAKNGIVDGATVRHFTGTNSPSASEEVRAVLEGTSVVVYTASPSHVRRVLRGTPGAGGQIALTFTIIDPPAGTNWCAIDTVRTAGGQTIVVVGNSTPAVASNGLSELYYTADGSVASPTWVLLTGDDAANDFVNQMGGPGGPPWWGYGIRAGAATTEMDPGRWILNTAGNGAVESVRIDPAHNNKIIAVGQAGAWMFDTSTAKSYPSMVGLMSSANLQVRVDPTDDTNIMVTNIDDLQLSTGSGGASGDWRKNATGTPVLTNPNRPTFFAADVVSGRWWAGFGEDSANTSGEVYFNDNPRGGNAWTAMGLAAVTGGSRPMGISVRRIAGVDVVLAAVHNGGIYKATFSTATPPVISGSWTLVGAAFSGLGPVPRTRAFDIYWVSDTMAYALDPVGIWRSTDAGATWSKIWTVACDNDRQGFICSPPDEPTTIYVSFGSAVTSPVSANGVWKLTNAGSGTVEGGQITKVEIKAPNGAHITNGSAIACTSGGRVGVVDMSFDSNPAAYLSTDHGATFVDTADTFFSRSARAITHSAMTTTGRWFLTMNGPGMIVYDTGAVSTGGTRTSPVTFDYIIGGYGLVTANFDEVSTSFTLSDILHGQQSSNATSYTTTTLTPTSGRTVYAMIETATSDGSTPAQPTVTGAGLTWSLVATVVYDSGTTAERRRMSVFAGTGTPSPGTVTFTFGQTQSHAIFVFIESNGSVVQALTASAPSASSITISPTPKRTPTTFLSFAAHKSTLPLSPGSGSQSFLSGSSSVSPSTMIPMLTSTNVPINVTASATDVKDMGLIVLELGTKITVEPTASFDFIVPGAAATVLGKTRAPRNFLSKAYATVGGNEIPIQSDWEFTETSYGGYEHAQFSVPESFARERQNLVDPDSVVTFWNASGDELWKGKVTKPPQLKDGLAVIEAQGAQFDARGMNERLLYQVAGTDGWAAADADPYNYISDHLYSVSVDPGRLLVKRQKVDNSETQNKEIFQNGDQAGWVLWAQDADISRIAFTIRKSDTIPNFNLIGWLVDGPSTNLGDPSRIFNFDLSDSVNPDGTKKDVNGLAGHHDLVAVMIHCTANNTKPDRNANLWLQDIRVNGLAKDDDMTTSQVARDIAYRLGWDMGDVQGNDYNALPYDVSGQDWGAALDYLSDLDGLPWQVYDGIFRRASWDTDEYETSHEAGALIDLAPEQVFDTTSVVWTGTSGRKHRATATQGNGAIYPPVEMQDTQRNGNNAADYADRLLAEFGAERYSGSVTVYTGDRLIHAGRNLKITDWDQGKSLQHKITTITQREDSLQLTIGWPQIVSHFLARLQQKQKRLAE